ncbi:outer membrane protein/protective antigen OMA87 [Rivularia sp. PCC 7116]|uniref:BamA/TamA family outer membrane protein n=1 Tax=Rivularia sp. PCC 7116 TaxID=373994 RepID=UPI00029F2D9D|nr:BamA/TamA family outer membrane protein [Rivularia sp. PCC 7116]AFY55598.1 outer membrane protein/protective antigen OMA87 [Rivularia sp. PCC 7116]
MKKVSALSIGIATASILGFVNIPIVQAQNIDTKNTPQTPQQQSQTEVLVAEVTIDGVEGKLEEIVANTIQTKVGKTITRAQLQQDINAIFATGYFANVRAVPEETSRGVKIKFLVQSNRMLLGVNVEGNQVLPQEVINQSFKEQYGKILNLKQFQAGIKKINQWYQDNGYVLAQVIDTPKVNSDGSVTLQVAEGVIENIQVQFVNPEGEEAKGKTQKYIITREMQLKPGEIFRREVAQKDLQRVYGLGIFQDINLKLNPAQDPRKVVLVVNVTEGRNFSVSPNGGYSSKSGLFAGTSFQLGNLNGRNQKLGADVEFSQRDFAFDVNYTDPWIGGDPYRTSYRVNGFRKRTFSQIFDGGETEVELANGDRPRVFKTGGNISFRRNLSKKVFDKSEWVASAGLKYQRVAIRDSDGDINAKDALGNDLSFSGDGTDDLLTVPLRLVRDKRNSSLSPTKGSVLSLSTEQSIPIGDANIFSNKLSGSYSFYLPTRLTKLTKGCRKSNNKSQECPQAFAFNLQGGTVIGDLPPYEAFSLGGANSVRGFGEGELGTARSFLQASAEYRFPVFSLLSGALFFDAATDLGTASSVTGNPAGARNKPGNGFGYGLGVRVKSPLGPIRLDYGYNNDGESRVQFGIGERF